MNQIILLIYPSLLTFRFLILMYCFFNKLFCRFITYTHLPEHAYHAIRILMTITSYPIPQSHMVSYFTSNPQLTIGIRHGFVQCLEEEESTKVIYSLYNNCRSMY